MKSVGLESAMMNSLTVYRGQARRMRCSACGGPLMCSLLENDQIFMNAKAMSQFGFRWCLPFPKAADNRAL
jgi:hypothetical protein